MPISVAKAAGLSVAAASRRISLRSSPPKRSISSASCIGEFEPRRQELLARRAARQKEFDAGKLPDFLPETRQVRESDWKVAAQPKDLLDRRVEITGPTDRKMVINALNSGASTFMADFEDANCPTWHNMIDGQINLRDAVRRTISFEHASGKQLPLNDKTAVLIPRPRGWHLDEKHVIVDGQPVVRRRSSTSACTSSTTRKRCSRAARARTSTCRRWSRTSRRGCGTTFSFSRRRSLAFPHGTHQGHRADRDRARRVRDGRDPLRAARALGRASTSGAGTTSSRASRNSAPTRTSASPTARR